MTELLCPVAAENLPAVQSVHIVLDIAPVLVENLPAKQSSQAALPDAALYLPAMHRVQLPAGPVDPAAQGVNWHVNGVVLVSFKYPELHVQFVIWLLSSGDVLNEGHSVHAKLPGRAAYSPTPQF